jgi:O-antigen/teichoic acid export membrane protein
VLGFFTVAWVVGHVAAPHSVEALLARFGSPSPFLAYGIGVAVIIWAFGSHFLYGMEYAPRAAVALKIVVVAYFIFSVACLTPPGRDLLASPASSLWAVTAIAYLAAAVVAMTFVFALPESSAPRRLGWFLPTGFWSVVLYTHLGTVVEFVYTSLAPSVVLLWLDVTALGRLTAALRWVTLVALLPSMLVSVVTPGLAKLEASGLRDDALRQARSAIRAAELAVVPAAMALVLFAPELMSVFGPAYRDDAGVLRIAALSALAGPMVYLGSGLAVAFGAMRGYLAGSVAYVAASLGLSVLLVPAYGLDGAACAITLSSATQCVAVAVVARRLGLRAPRTTGLAWAFGVVALALAWIAGLSWPEAVVAWLVLTALFTWSAGVSLHELRSLAGRAFGVAP